MPRRNSATTWIWPATGNDAAARARSIGWLFWLAIGLGAWLRIHQIGNQILGDDEWHSLNAIQNLDYAGILTHFGVSDHCIPLTLLHELLHETIGISELRMRALPLIAGIASIAILPTLLRDLIGGRASSAFAVLLAVSPIHAYFSRTVRPYGLVFLLCSVAILSFHRWYVKPSARAATLFVVCASLASWCQPVVIPFLFTPIVCEGVRALWSAHSVRPRIVDLVRLGAFALGSASLLLAPAAFVDWHSLAERAGSGTFDASTWRQAARLFAGTASPFLLAGWFVASAAGLVHLARRRSLLAWHLAAAGGGQVLALLAARPSMIEDGIVFVRYALPVLLALLVGTAITLARLEQLLASRRTRWPDGLLPIGFGIACLVAGPLPRAYWRPNDWTNHGVYQFYYEPTENPYMDQIRPRAIPRFYLELSKLPPGEVLVAEAPFRYEWHLNNFVLYQEIHRQRTVAGLVNSLTLQLFPAFVDDPGGAFRNMVDLGDPARVQARGVRYVILHRALHREISFGNEYRTPMRPVIDFYRRVCGSPLEDGGLIVVFDLSRCIGIDRDQTIEEGP